MPFPFALKPGRNKTQPRRRRAFALLTKYAKLNKETIIIDAIDYIKVLKISDEDLTREIYAMEVEMANEQSFEIIEIRPEEKMKKWGIESEVALTNIDENRIELVDISVTNTKGAVLVTSCIVGTHGKSAYC
ncbi:hypothetical protein Tco_0897903 [Tanacetum coccineum]